MSILVTGASGFVGKVLIDRLLGKEKKVYGLSRHPPEARENLIPLIGDVVEQNLGLKEVPDDISAVHHLAAIHKLGPDKDGAIWETNVKGTQNVINFCVKHDIPHLYFTSTAYVQGRNDYERSKALCETMARESDIPQITIFKPSIVMGTPWHFYPGHFSQFVTLLIKVHQRAEIARRWLESRMRLPVIRPIFRIRGNPNGKLNMICIDDVATAIADINEQGTYWLTSPSPPTLKEITEWIGEMILLDIKVEPEFKPTPIERMFQRLSAAFQPYLWGDSFQSNIQAVPIDKKFIQETIRLMLINLTSVEL